MGVVPVCDDEAAAGEEQSLAATTGCSGRFPMRDMHMHTALCSAVLGPGTTAGVASSAHILKCVRCSPLTYQMTNHR